MTERYSPASCPANPISTHKIEVSDCDTERGTSAPPHIDCSITQQPTGIVTMQHNALLRNMCNKLKTNSRQKGKSEMPTLLAELNM